MHLCIFEASKVRLSRVCTQHTSDVKNLQLTNAAYKSQEILRYGLS